MKLLRTSFCAVLSAKRMMCKATTNAVAQAKPPKERFINNIFDFDCDLSIKRRLQDFEKSIDDKHWAEARQEIKDKLNLSETVIDSQIIDLCTNYNRPEEAIKYIQFLERNNNKLNLNILGKYLKTFYLKGTELTAEEEEIIYKIYDDLRKKYPLMDSSMCNNCIAALSLTKRWKEGLELFDMIKISNYITISSTTPIICAAFKNNKPDLAWDLMSKYLPKVSIKSESYLAYLDYCKKYVQQNEWQKEIEKMFQFWKKYDLLVTEEVMKSYCDFYQTFGYNVNHTKVLKSGICYSCKTALAKTTLTDDEFKTLSKAVLKNVIIGQNLFCSTSPQELKNYMLFIQTMRPYDVVIDGLNVAYASKRKDQRGSLQNILNVVFKFYKEEKKVLVIGRAHMEWWNRQLMKNIRRVADVHLVKNISEDDPFLLHVTLVSGPQTYFVSKDLMRSQKSRLNPNLQSLFKRWQLSRQYQFHLDPKTLEIHLQPPILFDIGPQDYSNGWHLPYTLSTSTLLPDMYSYPQNWVCLRKKNNIIL